MRRLLGVFVVLVMSAGIAVHALPAPPAHASAALWTTYSRNTLFAGYMRSKHNPESFKDTLLSMFLLSWRRHNRNVSEKDLRGQALYLRKVIDDAAAGATGESGDVKTVNTVFRVLRTLREVPKVGDIDVAPYIKTVLNYWDQWHKEDWEKALKETAQYWGSAAMSEWMRLYNTGTDEHYASVPEWAEGDDAFRNVWNGEVGYKYGIPANASWDWLSTVPEIRAILDLRALRNLVGRTPEYVNELRASDGITHELLVRLLGTVETAAKEAEDARAAAERANRRPPVPDQVRRYQEAVTAAEERQRAIDGAGAAIFIISSLIGFHDPEAAKDVRRVGEGTLQIISSISKFVPEIVGLGLAAALTGPGALVALGGITNGILTMLPVFTGEGPSDTDLVLGRLDLVREEIRGLGEYMESRFDRIEQGLNKLYGDMIAEFAKLDGSLEQIKGRLAEISLGLGQIEMKVDFYGQKQLEALGLAALNDFDTMKDLYIDYAQKNSGRPLTDHVGFGEAESAFYRAATQIAKHPTFVESENPDLAVALDNYKVYGLVSYLAGRARDDHDRAIPAEPRLVPNVTVWEQAANAYATLAIQNPDLAREKESSRARAIVDQGRLIQQVASSLSVPSADPGAGGRRTNKLFTGLMGDYKTALAGYASAVKAVMSAVLDGKDAELFGLPDQVVRNPAALDGPAELGSCGTGAAVTVPVPANARGRTLGDELMLAQILNPAGHGYSACADVQFVNVRDTDVPFLINADIRLVIHQSFTVNGSFVPIRTLQMTWPLGDPIPRHTASVRLPQLFAQTWPAQRPAFEAGAQVTSHNPQVITQMRQENQDRLSGLQLHFYKQLKEKLATPGSDAHRASGKLAAAVKKLRAYTQIALPVTVQADGVLHGLLWGANTAALPTDIPMPLPGDTAPPAGYLRAAYDTAIANYATCLPAEPGQPCTGTAHARFVPLAGQPWLDTTAKIVQEASGRCLDIYADKAAAGTPVVIYDCHGDHNQHWYPDGDGRIVARGGVCLGVQSGYARAVPCDGGAAQRWTVHPDGPIVHSTGKCLATYDGGTDNLSQAVITDCDGSAKQRWLSKLGTAPSLTGDPVSDTVALTAMARLDALGVQYANAFEHLWTSGQRQGERWPAVQDAIDKVTQADQSVHKPWAPHLMVDGWRVTASSQETQQVGGAAVNAIDQNVNTFWHSQASADYPHEITVDLMGAAGGSKIIEAVSHTPRQDGNVVGRVGKYEIHVSMDGSNWGAPVASGAFRDVASTQTVRFTPVQGRYVRLRALGEAAGRSRIAAVAELAVDAWNPPDPAARRLVLHTGSLRCLDVYDNSTAADAPVIIYDCHGAANQQWRKPLDTGAGPVRNKDGTCLDVKQEAELRVVVNTCGTAPAQQWEVRPDGTLHNTFWQRCAATRDQRRENLTGVVLVPCDGGDAGQVWGWDAMLP
ncbi:ricin-type beta-trefoil lectin domain protein [Sphaerisporangium aureirubrum]|uniref:Ricin-type beta-trefoil lectin domain protein n=1 Tax=Sphaerisporangium aureirubrum TaxID=1544736 RepID=A0ABW1NCC8_9ACTN